MEVHFWGVRGSIASAGPDHVRYGGNTSCLEVRSGGNRLIFDAGTGIRLLGNYLKKREARETKTLHLFLSHFHIDHLCGLPFFFPLYQRRTTLHLYAPQGFRRTLRQILSAFFSEEFFPVPMTELPARLKLHPLTPRRIKIGPFVVTSFYINHPGQTMGYLVQNGGKRLAFLSDHEPARRYHHLKRIKPVSYEKELLKQLRGVDLLIHDGQFADREYPRHRGWGHSPWGETLLLAKRAGVKSLVLSHHAPEHSDRFLLKANTLLQQEVRKMGNPFQLLLAREGMTLRLK